MIIHSQSKIPKFETQSTGETAWEDEGHLPSTVYVHLPSASAKRLCFWRLSAQCSIYCENLGYRKNLFWQQTRKPVQLMYSYSHASAFRQSIHVRPSENGWIQRTNERQNRVLHVPQSNQFPVDKLWKIKTRPQKRVFFSEKYTRALCTIDLKQD